MAFQSFTVWQAEKLTIAIYISGFKTKEDAHDFGNRPELKLIYSASKKTLNLIEPSGKDHSIKNNQIKQDV